MITFFAKATSMTNRGTHLAFVLVETVPGAFRVAMRVSLVATALCLQPVCCLEKQMRLILSMLMLWLAWPVTYRLVVRLARTVCYRRFVCIRCCTRSQASVPRTNTWAVDCPMIVCTAHRSRPSTRSGHTFELLSEQKCQYQYINASFLPRIQEM